MTTASHKKKIKALVDDLHDAKTLRERLDRAEEDFRSGRVMDVSEARRQLRASLEQHRSDHDGEGKL